MVGVRGRSSADGEAHHPAEPRRRRPAPGMERSIASRRRRRARPAVLLDRVDGARRQDADPPPWRARRRSTSCPGAAHYTWGPTGWSTRSTPTPATSSTSRPARSTSRRTPRTTEPLVVVLTRNCPDSHVVYLDGGPDGATSPGTLLRLTTSQSLRAAGAVRARTGLPRRSSRTTAGPGPALTVSSTGGGARFVLKRTSPGVGLDRHGRPRRCAAQGRRGRGHVAARRAARRAYLGTGSDGEGIAILMPTSRATHRLGRLTVDDLTLVASWTRSPGCTRCRGPNTDRRRRTGSLAVVPPPGTPGSALAPVRRGISGRRPRRRRTLPGRLGRVRSTAPASARGLLGSCRPTRRRSSTHSADFPRTGLHGDLKLADVAPSMYGRVALIDWQMMVARARSRSSSAGCWSPQLEACAGRPTRSIVGRLPSERRPGAAAESVARWRSSWSSPVASRYGPRVSWSESRTVSRRAASTTTIGDWDTTART